MRSKHTPPAAAAGYRLDLGEQLAAELHSDGALTLDAGAGGLATLDAPQVEKLAELLALGAGLRSQARRRRARAAYLDRHGEA